MEEPADVVEVPLAASLHTRPGVFVHEPDAEWLRPVRHRVGSGTPATADASRFRTDAIRPSRIRTTTSHTLNVDYRCAMRTTVS